MTRLIWFLLVAVCTSFVASSLLREDSEEEDGSSFANQELSDMVDGMQALAIECESAVLNPFLQLCDNMIPVYTLRELCSLLDEAISNEDLNLIKLLEAHDKLAGLLNAGHIDELYRSSSQISTEIIDFIFALPWFNINNLDVRPLWMIYYGDTCSLLDEAVSNEDLNLIKTLEAHDKLAGVLNAGHIEELYRSSSHISTKIIDFIFTLPWFNINNLNFSPFWLINNYIPTSLKKFKKIWAAFDAESMLSVSDVARIVYFAAKSRNFGFYWFIIEHVAGGDNCNDVLKQAFSIAVGNNQLRAAKFLFQNGVSMSILDTDLMVAALRMFTVSNYPEFVRLLLSDRDVYTRVRVTPDSPVHRALNMDLPEIVEIFVQAYPDIQESGLAMLAFTNKRLLMLEHFKAKGVLEEDILFRMALNSIERKDLEALKMVAGLGLHLNLDLIDSRGMNLLSVAIGLNFMDGVEYLIKTCAFDVNAYNVIQNPDNTRIMIPPVILAKSPAMVHCLSVNGADMDAQYQKISDSGAVLRSATAMHQAASKSNMAMFRALLENGAQIEVPDSTGQTNETFYYTSFLNNTSKF